MKRRVLYVGLFLAALALAAGWRVLLSTHENAGAVPLTTEDNASLLDAAHPDTQDAPPSGRRGCALTAQRIRIMPDGGRRTATIQYDYPFLHAVRESGSSLLDMEAQRLRTRSSAGRWRVFDLSNAEPYCAWYFTRMDPARAGAEQVENVEYNGSRCTVWELPGRNGAGVSGSQKTMPCQDLAGARITLCNDVPLPMKLVYPDGVVERLESVRLLPAGSLRKDITSQTAP